MPIIHLPFEFLIPRRPVSLQAKPKKLQQWKNFVRSEAQKIWTGGSPIQDANLQLTLVYLCDDYPPDIDNIIKPIQDALVGLVFEDDNLVSDVDSHRRFLSDPIDFINLPYLLQYGVLIGQECVYVKVSKSQPLEKYL
ncbi:Endodeoxyribonuclease RusA [Nostoc sp. PCC 7524]|jgi:crossover junction endodeoxyribonuclease RusA|uniref:RusA family crossover junction endodeoxyribonuclease n=1 Tax=Nostoc sp. (strain ATCC 29411 / PCC 7524) TaxID=28072 RepID=UPI00029EF4CD|nr:RusA family crossover junction endodeoxyribonuclease [Nostoc sp. PCC 7524]AFY49506.1 Endodeoxyribonuclease RusA [Nostoc sp. PCC 7524]